ncbi:MAG: DUF1796 family putative cysteine peptidase [Parachlamydiaceae bacterium]|nr:DUF1796 family putative cysteine peptidase [Parachlamydiaceae bacterium]
MNSFKKIHLIFCLIFFQTLCFSETHIISIGRDCQVANMLQHFNLKLLPYPFDWMDSSDFKGLMLAIENDLQHFLDPNYLKHEGNFIKNTYYNFVFNHFFPIVNHPLTEEVFKEGRVVTNFLDYLPHVQRVQNQRIENFLSLLSTTQDLVFFIRTHSNPEEANVFVEMMKQKYPHLNFILVVVHDRFELIGDWNIPRVINFYTTMGPHINKVWWKVAEWKLIFIQLGLIKCRVN